MKQEVRGLCSHNLVLFLLATLLVGQLIRFLKPIAAAFIAADFVAFAFFKTVYVDGFR